MATYNELMDLFSDGAMINRVTVATIISAQQLLAATPTAADKAYAAMVFAGPQSEAQRVWMSVLATNRSITVAQIQSATDAQIQTAVDAVVPKLRDALAGV